MRALRGRSSLTLSPRLRLQVDVNSRLATPDDIPACVILRGQTRENAISVERLAAMGIAAESWANDVRSGVLTGYVCTDGQSIIGYCFGENASGEVVVLALRTFCTTPL